MTVGWGRCAVSCMRNQIVRHTEGIPNHNKQI